MSKVVISFLLDRTGSMQQIKDDVIGGYNQFIEGQQKETGELKFRLTQFDSQSIDEGELQDIADVERLTLSTYQPRAMTPLLDAVGTTIRSTEKLVDEDDRVLVVVFTDGLENASKEYTLRDVKQLVEEKQQAGWGFIFMGVDMDAYSQASAMGVSAGSTVSTAGGQTASTYAAVTQSVSSARRGDKDYMNPLKAEERRQKKGKKGKR